jgi:general stress protein 26
MTKNEALKLAQTHVNKSSAVIVTADGNVFFAEQRHFATHNAREKNVELFEFSNDELVSVKESKKEESAPVAKGEDKPSKKAK